MSQRAFRQVDVFTAVPYRGNPVAVVLDAEGLSAEAMQRIAAWTNLSETTFVLPPTDPAADYQLRIFTPVSELRFAGHPTLGSAHALLESGRITPREGGFTQQCGAGLLPMRVEDEPGGRVIHVRAPRPLVTPVGDAYRPALEAALGAAVTAGPPLAIDVGPVWAVADLGSAAAVDALDPDMAALAEFSRTAAVTGVVVFGELSDAGTVDPGVRPRLHVRAFAPGEGVPEDPVCGSGNISVAMYLERYGRIAPEGDSYVARQGMALGRDGRIAIRVEADGSVWLGGACVTCVTGWIGDTR